MNSIDHSTFVLLIFSLNPLMVKHTQTVRRLLPTNCLSVFDHVVGLGVKRLNPLSHFVLHIDVTIEKCVDAY